MIIKENENIIVFKYKIPELIAKEKDVNLHVEISDKPEHPNLGKYQLSVYL